jgi:hypothetical protein
MRRRFPALACLAVLCASCASDVIWVRSGRSEEANRADYAACQEQTARRLQAEFAYERALAGESIPSGPGMNPVPQFPAIGSIARGSRDDFWTRQDVDAGRVRADFRRQELMRACLTRAGFTIEGSEGGAPRPIPAPSGAY